MVMVIISYIYIYIYKAIITKVMKHQTKLLLKERERERCSNYNVCFSYEWTNKQNKKEKKKKEIAKSDIILSINTFVAS